MFMACICNYIDTNSVDTITHLCLDFIGGSFQPTLNSSLIYRWLLFSNTKFYFRHIIYGVTTVRKLALGAPHVYWNILQEFEGSAKTKKITKGTTTVERKFENVLICRLSVLPPNKSNTIYHMHHSKTIQQISNVWNAVLFLNKPVNVLCSGSLRNTGIVPMVKIRSLGNHGFTYHTQTITCLLIVCEHERLCHQQSRYLLSFAWINTRKYT